MRSGHGVAVTPTVQRHQQPVFQHLQTRVLGELQHVDAADGWRENRILGSVEVGGCTTKETHCPLVAVLPARRSPQEPIPPH